MRVVNASGGDVVSKGSLWNDAVARDLIDEGKGAPGALLPILHRLRETFGYIDREAEALVADALNISRAEVHGVVTFYHDFRQSPPPVHTLKLCRAEACQSMGGDRQIGRAHV